MWVSHKHNFKDLDLDEGFSPSTFAPSPAAEVTTDEEDIASEPQLWPSVDLWPKCLLIHLESKLGDGVGSDLMRESLPGEALPLATYPVLRLSWHVTRVKMSGRSETSHLSMLQAMRARQQAVRFKVSICTERSRAPLRHLEFDSC